MPEKHLHDKEKSPAMLNHADGHDKIQKHDIVLEFSLLPNVSQSCKFSLNQTEIP